MLAAAAPAVDYEKDIKPLLKERCVSCHGSVKQKGDLRLDAGALIDKSIHADLIVACPPLTTKTSACRPRARDSPLTSRAAEAMVR
jgi:hypothetical protein